MLTINGYDDKKAVSTINKETFETIEDFAKDVLPDLIDPSEYSLYYGIFKNNIPKFRIRGNL